MKIYLGAPMFERADIEYNLYIANRIRSFGIQVYCPNENMSINDKSQVGITPEMIYHADIEEMLTCNILLCRICDDAGVMWEAGYMNCLANIFPEKYYGCIGLTTDIRWQTLPNPELPKADNQAFYFNGFAVGGLKKSLGICYTEDDLFEELIKIKNNKEGNL